MLKQVRGGLCSSNSLNVLLNSNKNVLAMHLFICGLNLLFQKLQTEPWIVTFVTRTRNWFICSRSVHSQRTWVISHLHMLQVLMQIKTAFLLFKSNAHQHYMVQLQHICLSFGLLCVASSLEAAPPSHDHKIHHSCVNKFHTSWKIFVPFLGYNRSLRREKSLCLSSI